MQPEAEKKKRETSSHDELKVEHEEDDTNDVIRVLLQPLFFFVLWVISGAKCPRNDGWVKVTPKKNSFKLLEGRSLETTPRKKIKVGKMIFLFILGGF